MSGVRIAVAGAGAIGCFVGGLLAAGGRDVVFLARGRVIEQIAGGLKLSDFGGLQADIVPVALSEDPAVLARADVILVTVKTAATAEMAALIAAQAPPAAAVVSLQNGLEAVQTLRRALPGRDVRGGMVPFNVVPAGPGHYHRATSGDIVIEAGAGELARLLSVPGLRVVERADIAAVQWGKLLINLNNALNALSGLTLQEQLLDRNWRRLMADQMAEALRVLRAAGIEAKVAAPVPAGWIPSILRLPTPLFRRIAAQMLTVDPSARTSMAYDLQARRATEIGALQGAILGLAEKTGQPAPLNRRVAGLIHAAGRDGQGLPGLSARQVRDG